MERPVINRDQLAGFLKDFQSIKQFENLFQAVNDGRTTLDDLIAQVFSAQSMAGDALAQISRIADALELIAVKQRPIPSADCPPPALQPLACDNFPIPNRQPDIAPEIAMLLWSYQPDIVLGSIADVQVMLPADGDLLTFDGKNWRNGSGDFLPLSGGTMTGQLLGALGTAGAPGFAFAGDADTGMWRPGADTIVWSTGGAERMRIDSAGNVGIGTPAPVGLLHTYKAVDGNVATLFTNGSTGASASITHQLVVGDIYTQSLLSYAGQVLVESNVGVTSRYSDYTYHIWRNGAGSERMRLDASGNLLIGLTAAGTTAAKTIQIANGTAPTVSVMGGQIYVESGALKYLGSSGTVTTVAPA